MSGLQLLQAIIRGGKKVSEAAAEIEIYPQVLVNAAVKNENKSIFREDEEVIAAIKSAEESMAGEGRILIRPSGTEPLVRVMIEGKDSDKIYGLAENIANLISAKFS